MDDTQAVDTTEEKQLPEKKRPGPMLGPERLLKKTRFAKLLLEPNVRYTRDEVCQMVGISENTYYEWSKDPSLPELAGIDRGVLNMRTKLYAAKIKEKALIQLEKVMEEDRNGLARVRAAEIILGMDTDLEDPVSDTDKQEAEALVRQLQPVFVVADQDTMKRLSNPAKSSELKPLDSDEDEVIDGEYTEIE